MERLIRNAWRAFWVGLGASSVLIAQSVLAPAPAPTDPASTPIVEPAPQGAPIASPSKAKTDPILSRNPMKKLGRGGQS